MYDTEVNEHNTCIRDNFRDIHDKTPSPKIVSSNYSSVLPQLNNFNGTDYS